MTVETPQPRDRVRWRRTSVIEGVVEETGADGIVVRDADGYKHLCQVDDATIEVLERADDPSDLPVGTIKRLRLGAVYAKREARDGEDPWVYLYGGTGDAQRRTIGDDVADTGEAIGAVAGSPADDVWVEPDPDDVIHERWGEPARPSVRLENTPHGLSIPDRQKVADLLVAGKPAEAVAAARNAGLDYPDADAYVRQMPEYETYLNHHGRTDIDAVEAARMRAMGFDRQPEFRVSDELRAEIAELLRDRIHEYVREFKLDPAALAGVVADIVYAAIVQDRKRGDR